MSLAEEYQRQFSWRDWNRALGALPDLTDQRVLDLGCGPGDLAAELSRRGAQVVGLDLNDDLLEFARNRRIPGAVFYNCDLRKPPDLPPFDGVWCSFAAAYFTNLSDVLRVWGELMKPGAWIALTEIDDLFAHRPISLRARELLQKYSDDGIEAGRYHFRMGRELPVALAAAGFRVEQTLQLQDAEFSSNGPATADVVTAWTLRFERMKLLQQFCGAEFETVRNEFLSSLVNPAHTSESHVYCCIAKK